ncbi:hypothetical protein [Lysinibacillus sp. FSL K6-3209]|uniref:hypothetical protein n=1 Tax=Lysinibacillus sp. FSL K6-3209 TaxID=2921497 RepID=UPI0030D874C5
MDDKELEVFDNMLFRGNEAEYLEITEIISNCITEIKKSNNIRYMILETWLVIDFFVLDAIGKAFNLNKFNTTEYDCKLEVLPKSFSARVSILEKLLENQKALPIDPNENAIKLPGKFWRFIKKEDEALYRKFLELLETYYQKHYPEISKKEKEKEMWKGYIHKSDLFSETVTYRANELWYETYKTIDKKWFERTRNINRIRNKAAHSYNPNDIYEELNKTLKFNGKNNFKKTKRYLLETIEELLKVKIT